MTHPVLDQIQRYGAKGLLVDTNILLLYLVGSFDRKLVSRFKRTSQFTPEDFDLLAGLLSRFQRIVTTPNVLSEVSNLSGQLGEPARSKVLERFAAVVQLLDEHYLASTKACQAGPFIKLGLTDSAILLLAQDAYLVLTDDLKLHNFLEKAGIDSINFNHIRVLGWN
jgi:hypothetical protein